MKTLDGKEVVEFGMELKGETREERELEYNTNWRKAEEASNSGKVICLSDLMCQAEQLHIEKIERPKSKRQTKLEKLISSMKKGAV